jgi:hypothetical protein
LLKVSWYRLLGSAQSNFLGHLLRPQFNFIITTILSDYRFVTHNFGVNLRSILESHKELDSKGRLVTLPANNVRYLSVPLKLVFITATML